jgi:hypothetical protein
MLVAGPSTSTRTVMIGLLTPVIPALLGLAMLAPAAHAEAPASTEAIPETVSEAQPAEGTTGESPVGEATGEPPVVDETPAAEPEQPPAPEAPPPAQEATPAPPESPAPSPEALVGEKLAESHPSDEHERGDTETPLPLAAASGGDGSSSALAAASDPGAPLPGAGPTGSEIVLLGIQSTHPPSGPGSGAPGVIPVARQQTLIAERAEQRRCELSSLGAPGAARCAGGWMTVVATQAPARAATGTVAASLAVATSGGGDGGNSAGGGRPVTPSPGPAPGGAAGGAASGGSGGGVGLTGFLTLAGLLLLAAPRALRRLRLCGRPYRTAFFVLIPERPG